MLHPANLRRENWQRILSLAVIAPLAILSLASGPRASSQQDRAAGYKEKYENEKDPVRKARALTNYGRWQVDEFVRQANANQFDAAFQTLTAYHNEVKFVFGALKARGVDPEKKPDGFKELEIGLDKSVWKLDRAVALVPLGQRQNFQDIHDDLDRIHNELIKMLFPRGPGGPAPGH
jgi:hypothetical protein